MSTHKKPPSRPTIFVDSSIGRKDLPEALRQRGWRVVHHQEVFPEGTQDEVWLSRVGKEGWLGLTHDQRIRYRTTELLAAKEAGAKLFVLACKGSLPGREITQIVLEALPKMVLFADKHSTSFVAKILRGGKIQLCK